MAIFPPPIPEISAIRKQPDGLISDLANTPLGKLEPQPCRRFLVPKDELSYRQASQLHPQDSILLTAIIYQYGSEIEKLRLSKDIVFSYRFDPLPDHGLYGNDTLWNDFWSSAHKTSESYPYVLCCDIADFYNQIYHHVVVNQLGVSGFPNQAVQWIRRLLESTTAGVSRGVPVGPHGIHLIAECTLIPIDNSLKAKGIEFLRYADDLVIFCNSKAEANRALHIFATTLDQQQRLMIQKHKTRIWTTNEFHKHCISMIEDRAISEDEDRILEVIRRYSGDNPYSTVTYNQVAPDDWKEFSSDIVGGIIEEYLAQGEIDYIRLRWFLRRLAQVGHHGALEVILDNIGSLEPCLPNVCSYISSIQEIPAEDWKNIGGNLLQFLQADSIFGTEFARLTLLSLFARNEHIDHFIRLAQRFETSDNYIRREILLAAKVNSEADWLREQKESHGLMDQWQRMAFMYCASILPDDERRHFLRRLQPACPFEQHLIQCSKDGIA